MLARYAERGNPQAFIDLREANYDSFVSDCMNAPHEFQVHVIDNPDVYLQDIVNIIEL